MSVRLECFIDIAICGCQQRPSTRVYHFKILMTDMTSLLHEDRQKHTAMQAETNAFLICFPAYTSVIGGSQEHGRLFLNC